MDTEKRGVSMEFRMIELPSFKAVSSGVDTNVDFSDQGILGKFNAYFSKLSPRPENSFMPRDFLMFDHSKGGMVWLYALTDELETDGYDIVDFVGGYFLTYVYKDGDEIAGQELFKKAKEFIAHSAHLEFDISENRPMMGHIITPKKIIEEQGWAQMESFIPIRLLNN